MTGETQTVSTLRPGRRRQEERSAETRTRLLEAAIDCLVERGWAATRTLDVAKRAGLSRGAQQHHFPTKNELLVEVTRYVTQGVHEDLREAAAELPAGAGRSRAAVDVLWRAYTGRRAMAHLELWVAARTDPDLHDVLYEVERSLAPESRRLLRRLFSESEEYGEQIDLFADMTAQFIRGLVLRAMLRSDSLWIDHDLEAWTAIAELVVPRIEAGEDVLPAVAQLPRANDVNR